ncbi:MAG: hypothetical protein KDK33_01460 [Leptospiraceae bacterium]|nr:hypothetical protein [Leptospiraceae bacterium]
MKRRNNSRNFRFFGKRMLAGLLGLFCVLLMAIVALLLHAAPPRPARIIGELPTSEKISENPVPAEKLPITASGLLKAVRERCNPKPCLRPDQEIGRYRISGFEKRIVREFDPGIDQFKEGFEVDLMSEKSMRNAYRGFAANLQDKQSIRRYAASLLNKLESMKEELSIKRKYEMRMDLMKIQGRLQQLSQFKKFSAVDPDVPTDFVRAEEDAIIQYRRATKDELSRRKDQ